MAPRARPTARDVARDVLARVHKQDGFANLVLASALARHALGEADRALATEIVYGVLRQRTRLDRALSACVERGALKVSPTVHNALRVAAYQILLLRVPAHAAVDDAVGAIKRSTSARLAGFANALLRRLASQGEPAFSPAAGALEALAHQYSLPAWLGADLLAACDRDEREALLAAAGFLQPPAVYLRTALHRGARAQVIAKILAERPGARVEASPLVAEAVRVHGGGAPEDLSVFADGLATVQDLAAQAIAHLVDVQPGDRVLDACAGVGGKASHLQELALARGGPAEIVAADLSPRKLALADKNLARLGLAGVHTMPCDLVDPAAAALASDYDRVLLDAPCSGLGVLRRHPELKWRKPPDFAGLAHLQAALLANVARRVRPGGVLLYSVCTFAPAEGAELVQAFLRAHPAFERTPCPLAAFRDSRGDFRSWPHRHDADAFFAARFVRRHAAC